MFFKYFFLKKPNQKLYKKSPSMFDDSGSLFNPKSFKSKQIKKSSVNNLETAQ